MTQAPQGRARLGPYELDTRAGELRCNGDRTVLPEQQFKVLMVLIERCGDIATREEIRKKLWPNDTIVEFEFGINNTIKNLRRTLCDSADEPKYIETIKGRGYRLIAPVEWVSVTESAEQSSAEPSVADLDGRPNPDTQNLPKATLKVGRLTGKVVSHYRVLEVIGGGGMGLVYRAEDLKLGRAVALKFLPEEVGDDPKARERFEREAKAVSALSHTNICPIYEFDDHEGLPFLAMERLQGKTLRDHLAAGRFRLTQSEGLEIAIHIASGLEAAHEKGIIHRDIKPANIFITEKNVAKILDFGVAKMVEAPDSSPANSPALPLDERSDGVPAGAALQEPGLKRDESGPAQNRTDARLSHPDAVDAVAPEAPAAAPAKVMTTLTRTGMKPGTAGYMSPEQVRGEPLDARTDLFSFGLVLYEMATGERAFTGETEVILHDAIQHLEPKPVRELNPELAPKLEAIINKALEKDREKRYQSAAEVRTELEQVNATTPLLPSPAADRRRSKWKWVVAAAMLIVAATAGVLYWRSRAHIKLTDKDTIVLTHFQNLTGDTVMDDALDWPLQEELGQSPYVNLLNFSKVRDMLKQLNVSNLPTFEFQLTPELAREVCLRSDSKAFITASIANVGNSYRIGLQAQDCHSGMALAAVRAETGDRNQIVHTLGTAGRELRRKLGEPEDLLTRFNTPLENDTSPSLDALQAYVEAMRLRLEKGNAEAIPGLKRTVQLDPNLAEAHLNLAGAGMYLLPAEEWQGHLSAAYKLRERLSPRSRWLVEAIYYTLATGDLEKARAAFEEWVRTFPADPLPHHNFAGCIEILGEYERAAAEEREVVRLLPSMLTYSSLVRYLVELDRPEEARAVFEEALKRGFDGEQLHESGYGVALAEHNDAAMQEQLAAAMSKPGGKEWGMIEPGDIATYHGRLHEAQKLYSTAQQESRWLSENTPDEVASHLAIAYAEIGNTAQAKRYVENILAANPYDDTLKATIALVLARVGAMAKAAEIAKSLDQKFPSSTLVQNFQLPTVRAAIAIYQKQPAQAVQELKPALRYDLANVLSQCQRLYPSYLRGLAYLQLGKGSEAGVEFQKIIDHPGIVGDCPTGPLSYLQLARVQLMMGDTDAARKSYQDFLTLWKDADPDIPIYRQAKAEYKKLLQLAPSD